MKIRLFGLLMTWLMSISVSYAENNERWIVDVSFTDSIQFQQLANHFDHYKLNQQKSSLTLEVGKDEFSWLQDNQFQLKINLVRTNQLQKNLLRNQQQILSQQGGGIAGFSCYRTVEETFVTAQSLVANHPSLASWIDVGDSWIKTQNAAAGYDLNVLLITNQNISGEKPPLFITSGVHAREYANAELVTRFAERLLSSYGSDPDATWLIDYHEIHLLLQSNPDGRKMAETGLSWRKNGNNNFCPNTNTRGIDLNRNFDFEWGCCGGSSASACDLTYRGPVTASEPETTAIQAYMDGLFEDFRDDDLLSVAPPTTEGIYLDIHSFGEVVLSSWGFSTTAPPNGGGILSLARKFAFFNNYAPQLGSFGIVDGSTKDYSYGRFGVPGYTIELGTAFFEDCGYFEQSIVPQNIDSLFYAAKAARQPYTISRGPDVANLLPFSTPFATGQMVPLTGQADDERYVNGNGVEPTQNISEAQYSIDTPPWTIGVSTSNFVAVDGIFNQPQENIEATIDTTGLTTGKHLIYMRAKDSDDHWGAVSALFLDIIDPLLAPVIQGTVTNINSGNPVVGAQVKLNDYEVQTDGNGAYSMQLPAGEYQLTVSMIDFQTDTRAGIVVSDSQASQQDFSLIPLVVIFEDDGEAGNNGWTGQNGWSLSTELAHSPTHAWSDSVGTTYPNNANFSLTSPVLDLTGINDATLAFKHQYNFESTYDFGHIEISANNGSNWTELSALTGESPAGQWMMSSYSLSLLNDAPQARIRFRVSSDVSVVRDGWHIDDVMILAPYIGNADVIFEDDFE